MEKMGATNGVGLIVYTGTREELCRKLRERDDYIDRLQSAMTDARYILANNAIEGDTKAGALAAQITALLKTQ